MTFADFTDELVDARAEAGEVLLDTCVITRPAADRTLDRDTGVSTPDAPTELYEGACQFLAPQTGFEVPFGQAQVTLVGTRVLIPITVTDVNEGDRVEAVTSLDGRIEGRTWRVKSIEASTLSLRRVLNLEEQQ